MTAYHNLVLCTPKRIVTYRSNNPPISKSFLSTRVSRYRKKAWFILSYFQPNWLSNPYTYQVPSTAVWQCLWTVIDAHSWLQKGYKAKLNSVHKRMLSVIKRIVSKNVDAINWLVQPFELQSWHPARPAYQLCQLPSFLLLQPVCPNGLSWHWRI